MACLSSTVDSYILCPAHGLQVWRKPRTQLPRSDKYEMTSLTSKANQSRIVTLAAFRQTAFRISFNDCVDARNRDGWVELEPVKGLYDSGNHQQDRFILDVLSRTQGPRACSNPM